MSWDAYVDSLKQRGMVGGAICGLDGSWFVASDGSKVRNPICYRWVCPLIWYIYRKIMIEKSILYWWCISDHVRRIEIHPQ